MDLTPCPSCNRNFNAEAFEKHVRVCNKVFQQKRKEFNSQAHRIVSNEHKQILQQVKRRGDDPPVKRQEPAPGRKAQDMPKWKKDSENFRKAMKNANGGGAKGGYNMAPQEESYDDRVAC